MAGFVDQIVGRPGGSIGELHPAELARRHDGCQLVGAGADPVVVEQVDDDVHPGGVGQLHRRRRIVGRGPRHVLERRDDTGGAAPVGEHGQLALGGDEVGVVRHGEHGLGAERRGSVEEWARIGARRVDAIDLDVMDDDAAVGGRG